MEVAFTEMEFSVDEDTASGVVDICVEITAAGAPTQAEIWLIFNSKESGDAEGNYPTITKQSPMTDTLFCRECRFLGD